MGDMLAYFGVGRVQGRMNGLYHVPDRFAFLGGLVSFRACDCIYVI